MPFQSKAQQRFFFSAEARGELPKGTALRWAHETPNIKKLPDKKKKSEKEAQYRLLGKAFLKHATLPPLQKTANSLFGTVADANNVVLGQNGLGRLESWNNVKGYLPEFARRHINNNYVILPSAKGFGRTVWRIRAGWERITGAVLAL